MDITQLSEQEKEQIRHQIVFYKENRELLQMRKYYRLESPFDGDGNVASWMSVSEDQSEAIVGYYQVLSIPNKGLKGVILKGLNPDFEYQIERLSLSINGDELMSAGLQLHLFSKQNYDFSSHIFKLIKVPVKQSTTNHFLHEKVLYNMISV